MPAATSFGSRQKSATVWLNFSNMNSKHAQRNLADARKAGQRDTDFHCYCTCGTCWTTASISSSGAIGFAEVGQRSCFLDPVERIIRHEMDLAIQWSHR